MSRSDKLISNKYLYEAYISPEKNIFSIGEKVNVRDCFNNLSTGYIENFNSNGTIFIKENFSDIGRDYSRNFISKL
jgi:hypothetical protein